MHILYEDQDLIFINKPAGLVVQRSHDETEPVLFEMVQETLAGRGEEAFMIQRLDRGTSGVIFFSKTSELNRRITRSFEKRQISKIYLALCEGRISQPQLVDAPVARIGPIKFGVRPQGRVARTRLFPLQWNDTRTLLRIELLTGRTHQIRVHLSALGHPLVGDWLYGERNAGRPMLHARECAMPHPRTNEPIRVTASLPDDFREAIQASGLQRDEPEPRPGVLMSPEGDDPTE